MANNATLEPGAKPGPEGASTTPEGQPAGAPAKVLPVASPAAGGKDGAPAAVSKLGKLPGPGDGPPSGRLPHRSKAQLDDLARRAAERARAGGRVDKPADEKKPVQISADTLARYKVAGKRIGEMNLAFLTLCVGWHKDHKPHTDEEKENFFGMGEAICHDFDWQRIPGWIWFLAANGSYMAVRVVQFAAFWSKLIGNIRSWTMFNKKPEVKA